MLRNKRQALILFVGDVFLLYFTLYISLWIRNLSLPSEPLFLSHIPAFSILIVSWLIVFFIAGLYEKHTLILKSRLPSTVMNAGMVNTFIAVLFFYSIPYLKITPKTILFIYLLLSFALLLLWRLYGI